MLCSQNPNIENCQTTQTDAKPDEHAAEAWRRGYIAGKATEIRPAVANSPQASLLLS